MPPRFLAIEPIPLEISAGDVRQRFEALARTSHELGIRPLETFYTQREGVAYTLFEAVDEESVISAHELAGLANVRVAPAERMYPDLLDEPRRAR